MVNAPPDCREQRRPETRVTVDPLTRATVLPIWTKPVRPIHMEGLSTISYFVQDEDRAYVVRFGRDQPFHHISRSRELMVSLAAHKAGFSPEIVHVGPGVVVGVYIDGVTYKAEDVRANIGRVAEMTRRFHEQMPRHVSGPGYLFWVFHIIRDYGRMLLEERHPMSDRIGAWIEIAGEMEREQIPLPIVFGHNDLTPSRIIDDGNRLWFVDFVHSGFSTALYDLASLAGRCEFAEDDNEALLEAYFGKDLTPPLRRSYDAMMCAAILRDVMWALVSEMHNDVPPGVDIAASVVRDLDRFDKALDRYRSRHGVAR